MRGQHEKLVELVLIKKQQKKGIFSINHCFSRFSIRQRSCLPGSTGLESGAGMQLPGGIHARLAAGRDPVAVERQSTDHEQFGGRRLIAALSDHRVRLLPYHRNHIHTLLLDARQFADERVAEKFIVV